MIMGAAARGKGAKENQKSADNLDGNRRPA